MIIRSNLCLGYGCDLVFGDGTSGNYTASNIDLIKEKGHGPFSYLAKIARY